MQVPNNEYTFQSFLEYLQQNHERVFEEDETKRWLKIYAVIHNMPDWKSGLFRPDEVTEFGELAEIRITRTEGNDGEGREERYYGGEYKPGFLIFFTSAVQEGYEQTLGKRIKKSRGAMEAWIAPDLFQSVWQTILEKYGGYIFRFTSRRPALDDTPSQIRPDFQRRFSYTGDDGTHVVKELLDLYGVRPDSMYLRMSPSLVTQITNVGFFSAREISPLALEVLFNIIDLIIDKILETKATSEKLKFEITNILGQKCLPRVASIVSGQIILHGNPLSASIVSDFIENVEDFSFIDTHLKEGSLAFSATVIDDMKGSVFNISMTDNQITMIPKYNTTFEFFIRFLRTISEQLDERASLKLWSEADGVPG